MLAVRAPPVVGTSSAPRSHGVRGAAQRPELRPRLAVDVGGRGERSLDPAAGAAGRAAGRAAAERPCSSSGRRGRLRPRPVRYERRLQVVVAGEADRRILARRSSRSPSAGREPSLPRQLVDERRDEERVDADRVPLGRPAPGRAAARRRRRGCWPFVRSACSAGVSVSARRCPVPCDLEVDEAVDDERRAGPGWVSVKASFFQKMLLNSALGFEKSRARSAGRVA